MLIEQLSLIVRLSMTNIMDKMKILHIEIQHVNAAFFLKHFIATLKSTLTRFYLLIAFVRFSAEGGFFPGLMLFYAMNFHGFKSVNYNRN